MLQIPTDPQNKRAWIQAFGSREAELDVIERMREAGLDCWLNPEKEMNPTVIDGLVTLPLDIKIQRTPFRNAMRLYGIPSEYAVTINPGPLSRYPSNALVLFDVRWPEAEGLYLVSVQQIRSRERPLHRYQDRVNDPENNRDGLVLDLREMGKLT